MNDFLLCVQQRNVFIDWLILTDILDNSAGEFEDTEELYEAIGEILQGISEKSEEDIRYLVFVNK